MLILESHTAGALAPSEVRHWHIAIFFAKWRSHVATAPTFGIPYYWRMHEAGTEISLKDPMHARRYLMRPGAFCFLQLDSKS